MSGTRVCPWCGFAPQTDKEYEFLMHIETEHPDSQPSHPEDRSLSRSPAPSPRRQSASRKSSPTQYLKKDSPGKSHSNLNENWKAFFRGHQTASQKPSPRVRHTSKASHKDAKAEEDTERSSSDKNRPKLGKSELGRHHREDQMPSSLRTLLEERRGYFSNGIVPVLQKLLQASNTTSAAWLCSPHVTHVSKLSREGSFCGYRNIQMLCSHIINSGSFGAAKFGDQVPSIFDIQELIENAWDEGINARGRDETGGIRGTRKYIGTPEAQAMFTSLQIPCSVNAFRTKDCAAARALLLDYIQQYFVQGAGEDTSKVRATTLPPIYFQHRGHSMTIVGLERLKNGSRNLIVFDPSYKDSTVVAGLRGKTYTSGGRRADFHLESYRKGTSYLRRHNEFEILV